MGKEEEEPTIEEFSEIENQSKYLFLLKQVWECFTTEEGENPLENLLSADILAKLRNVNESDFVDYFLVNQDFYQQEYLFSISHIL